MIYKVIANHLINVDLGVVGYLPDGMRFLDLVIDTVVRLPRVTVEIPVKELDRDEIHELIRETLTSHTYESRCMLPRTDLTFLHDFFTLLTDEYRRWKFNVAMEASTESYFNGLTPLLDLALMYKEQDSSHWVTLKHYTLDLMATAVTEAVMAHYVEPVKMFLEAHNGAIRTLVLKVDFPKTPVTNALDMRLLIDVPEEE
ncbi:hypothetical protein ZS59_00010 [Salmonella enterica subsp. enterica serovar Typhimurium]|nr:hypothetical protein [Salmonella enterica subsp. enterica serovar Typhimurium]